MNETPFEQFIALVQVDQNINTLRETITSLTNQNQQTENVDKSNNENLEKIKTKLHDIRKEVDSKELEMKILDDQEADKKKRLDQVANHKEYQSIKNEIDQLKKAQHALEDTLVKAWNSLETVKKEHELAITVFEQQHQGLFDKISQNDNKIAEITQQIELLLKDRLEKEKTVPAEWLEKYAIMRTKITNPVVPVIDGNCSACFYKVSAQDTQLLKRRKLVQCKDCFRLLYLPEAQGSEQSE